MLLRLLPILACLCLPALPAFAQPQRVAPDSTLSHALAHFGQAALPADFAHLPFANPDAPKGGAIRLAEQGSFDTLNDIPLGGEPASTVALAYDPLMVLSDDELGAAYGLVAEAVEYPADYSWIVFHLDPAARFHDGTAITAEDVAWTFRAIGEHGNPFLKSFFKDIGGVEVLDAARVRFTNRTPGIMKPLLSISQLSPRPQAWWDGSPGRDIARSTLVPPLGSGPYKVSAAVAGSTVTLERVRDYWAADKPIRKGMFNFDSIVTEYYRDMDVLLSAFLAGRIDMRQENVSRYWAGRYTGARFDSGELQKRELPDRRPSGVQAYFLNMRRSQFQDVRVRAALDRLMDFEFLRRTQFYGSYTRLRSYFPNSDYGASGLPSPEELALLEPFRDSLPPEVFTQTYEPPSGDGSGTDRARLREARRLLSEAGWAVQDGALTHTATGQKMRVEFLYDDSTWERLIAPYAQNLRSVGIDAVLRLVDSAQYQARVDNFDFDITYSRLNFFPPPGPEMRSYYGSAEADAPGSANLSGFKSAAADAMIERIIAAKDPDTLRTASHALDRILLFSRPGVLQWGNDTYRIAYRNRFGWPEKQPTYNVGMPHTWWADPAKAAAPAQP